MSAAMVFLPAAVGPFWLGYWQARPSANSKEVNRAQIGVGLGLAALPLLLRFTRRGARMYVELKQVLKMKALTESMYSLDGVGGMHGLKLQRFRNVCMLTSVATLGLGIASTALTDARNTPTELQKPVPVRVFGQSISVLMALPTAYALVYTPLTMVPVLGVVFGTKYLAGK